MMLNLKSLTIIAAAASLALATPIEERQTLGYNCLPGMPCFPTQSEWQAFNRSIGGALKATVPWAKPCFGALSFGTAYNQAQCDYISSNYADNPIIGPMGQTVGYAREAQYGSNQNLQWETCANDQCLLQSGAPQVLQPILKNCTLGRLSAYYVNATTPAQVAATINFSKQHQIRMSVKGTGCDYLGRSSSANSLALWTRNMKNLQYIPNFVASRCPAANTRNVGIMGAGVVADEAEKFFTSKGMQITAGAVGSVGLAGGFGQGGGHGAFGPKYGLMVDNAVEFDVITADGVQRTINQCNDPDLFYAMRGGGGGTYAVLLNYKFKVYPEVPMHFFAFKANFPALDLAKTALKDVLTALALNQTNFSNNNVAGYNFYYNDNFETYQVLPEGNDGLNKLKALTKTYRDYLMNYPGLQITQNEYITFQHQTDFANYTTPIGVRNTPQGYAEVLAGRLIPRSLFTPANVTTLVQKFMEGMATSQNLLDLVKPIATQIYATGPANNDDNSKTGVNPAWRGSLWEVVYAGGWVDGIPKAATDAITQNVHNGMDSLRQLTPGGGCYVNEADTLEEDWQTAFFGSNYNRLLSIKQRYDPTSFFNCWKCVGWNGASDPQYSCYQQSTNPPVPTIPF